jgi:hypothetical protein
MSLPVSETIVLDVVSLGQPSYRPGAQPGEYPGETAISGICIVEIVGGAGAPAGPYKFGASAELLALIGLRPGSRAITHRQLRRPRT